ncbi:MAG: zinc-binding dehydrogenase [Candidatus Geothermarchaeales archaeon]
MRPAEIKEDPASFIRKQAEILGDMKAVVFYEHGGLEKLVTREVPTPKLSNHEVLVRVEACALNHLDVLVREGIPGLTVPLPHICGSDVAGVVSQIRSETQDLQVGDRVIINPALSCGKCEFCVIGEESMCIDFRILGEHVNGGYAESVKAPRENIIPIPDHVHYVEAAAVPLVFMTAWRMLVTRAKVRAGEDVLILGAGGGVASAAIQIAKLLGARVFVTSSTDEKLRKAEELGADAFINHSDTEFDREVWALTGKRGVDVVVDSVGSATWERSIRSLSRGGRLVTCGAHTGSRATTDLRYLYWRQLQIVGSTMATLGELKQVLEEVWKGRLRPVVDRVLPLEQAREAQRAMMKGEQFGKIVLEVS